MPVSRAFPMLLCFGCLLFSVFGLLFLFLRKLPDGFKQPGKLIQTGENSLLL